MFVLPGLIGNTQRNCFDKTAAAGDTETTFHATNHSSSATLVTSKQIENQASSDWANTAAGTTQARSSGLRYAELAIDVAAGATGIAFGVCDASQTLSGGVSAHPGGISGSGAYIFAGSESGQYNYCYGGDATPASGTRWWDGTNYENWSDVSAISSGYIKLALDIPNGKLWFGVNSSWAFAATPADNGSGYSFIDRTPQTSGGYMLYAGCQALNNKVTIRTKASEFSGSIPSGFTAWDNGTA